LDMKYTGCFISDMTREMRPPQYEEFKDVWMEMQSSMGSRKIYKEKLINNFRKGIFCGQFNKNFSENS